jgi:hypothetical protein
MIDNRLGLPHAPHALERFVGSEIRTSFLKNQRPLASISG